MDNWQEVKLGDVCNIFTGKKDVNQTDENGKYIFFSCSPKEFRSNEYLYDGKAIIVAGNGSYTGRVRFFNGKFDLYQRTYACVQKNSMNNINMSFIYYVMKGKFEPKYLGGTRGSSIPYIVMGDLSNFPISLPPLEVQKKIAGVLGALDDKIELNNRINQNLESQAQTLFIKTTNTNNFDTRLLFEIATIKYGKGLPTSKLTKAGYKVFGGNGIIGYYTEFLYKEPQILISCRGAASGTILESHPYSYITNNSLIIELNDRRYYEFLKQYFLLNQLHSYATGSAQPQITIDNLKTVEVPYPDYKTISSIDECFTSISNKMYRNICENEKLANLRDILLPKLMSGEINVDKVDI